jgi:hypothetical protein
MSDQGELFPEDKPQADPMAEVLARLKALENENQALRAAVEEVQTTPGHLMSGPDFAPDPRAARSVVIATRPVRDNPELYSGNKPVVDASGLSVNNSSPLSGKNQDLR